MAVQGPVIAWVADHRKHHAHTDVEGDPHSPHVGHGDGVSGVLRGLWHAHTGWLLSEHGRADWKKYAPRPLRGPRHALHQPSTSSSSSLLGLALPALAGYLLTGTLLGAATGLLWGGLVRVFLVHHVTWSVNSVCHFLGTRRFEVDDQLDATSSGSRCLRWASPGTTTTTRSRARPCTACDAGSSIPPPS